MYAQGLQAFRRGSYAEAIDSWQAAARFYEQAGQYGDQSEALTHLASAYQALGRYAEAAASLDLALTAAKQVNDQARIALALSSLGSLHTATGPEAVAAQYLQDGLTIARRLRNDGLSAALLNNLGTFFASQRKYERAFRAYEESASLADAAKNPALAAQAFTHAARAALLHGQYAASRARADTAFARTQLLAPSSDKAYGLMAIGLTYRDLRPYFPEAAGSLLLRAYQAFEGARAIATTVHDRRTASYAWGYLGALYEEERRYQEALRLTQRAVFAAQQADAPESLYLWHWQTGRVLAALHERDRAIAAYRRAVETLQSIRYEMLARHGNSQTSFRETTGPVYLALVDLLLQRAASTSEPQQRSADLKEARQTVESLKVAELRDYFGDDCVEALRSKARKLDDLLSETTAVIYPVLLQNRLELLVSLPGGLKSIAVPVGEQTFRHQTREFRRKVVKRTTREYLPHAQQLYDWLIRPLEPDLRALNIRTLVVVPDGPVRTIPVAALHDGTQFLVRRYALATTPGLELTDPRPLQRTNVRVLAAGLSEPVQGFPALPHVATELQSIRRLYNGPVFLNQAFRAPVLEREMREESFSIVHLASHGQFAGDVTKTFILTFDDRLTLDRLDQLVGLFRFRDDPLELLTLSACETAAGDERAALGLAGIAVKAGARSALATLWRVSDEAAALLITEFYRQLTDPRTSRAVALQRAQIKILDDPRYQHPGYWSPFLLINNWL
ncbi:MAG: CHAT domain-containing protein [Thermodesulfobacteriota bacterium]